MILVSSKNTYLEMAAPVGLMISSRIKDDETIQLITYSDIVFVLVITAILHGFNYLIINRIESIASNPFYTIIGVSNFMETTDPKYFKFFEAIIYSGLIFLTYGAPTLFTYPRIYGLIFAICLSGVTVVSYYFRSATASFH